MGIRYLDSTWLVWQPAVEEWAAAATVADRASYRYHLAAATALLAALALMMAPVLVAALAIAGILG